MVTHWTQKHRLIGLAPDDAPGRFYKIQYLAIRPEDLTCVELPRSAVKNHPLGFSRFVGAKDADDFEIRAYRMVLHATISQGWQFNSSSFAKNTATGAGRRAAKTRPNSR